MVFFPLANVIYTSNLYLYGTCAVSHESKNPNCNHHDTESANHCGVFIRLVGSILLLSLKHLKLNVLTSSNSCIIGIRKGWFSNTSFTTGLKTLPTFRPDALGFFRAKMKLDLRSEEDQSIWSIRRQGFEPCCEAGIGEPTLSDA